MEKPVATDPAGIQKVLATAAVAKQKKLNVVVGLQRRYQNSYKELYKRKDMIGDITSMQAWWNNDGVWVRPRKPEPNRNGIPDAQLVLLCMAVRRPHYRAACTQLRCSMLV